jgi:phosphohistidine phosphatase
MRLVTLVRHAKSSWDYPELSDFERPLNERGRRDAPRMAARVPDTLGLPDRLVTSPALRAITTARYFLDVLQLPEERLVVQPQIYEASDETLLALVRRFDDGDTHVMMFGHNPGFTELAHALAPCPFDDLPTCAIVQIEFAARRWSDIGERGGRVRHYFYPKQFKD